MRNSPVTRIVSDAVAPAPDVRASDAERERTAECLRDHAAAGRLDVDELGERLGTAYAARTRVELGALLADLPRSADPPRSVSHAKELGFKIHRNVYLLVGVLLLAIWASAGAGYFWPMWPLTGWGIGVLSHALACRSSRRNTSNGRVVRRPAEPR